jgi:hypothetical protein
MKRISILLLAATFAVPACSNDVSGPGKTGDDDDDGMGSGSDKKDTWDTILDSRVVDYSAALKTAALRLTGSTPTMTEINQVALATGDEAKKAAYEALITDYLTRPTFARMAMDFWRNTMKIGGSAMFDTAPALAAQLTVTNGSYLDMFTKATDNCPTFNEAAGTFTAAACTNGGPQAGVITNQGVMQSFFSNFGFRRVRWVQETFDCLRFPAEVSATPTDIQGASPYTGVWPFASIAGADNGGRVDFHDKSSSICANCHSTINHIAPLFAYYDATGVYKAGTISVPTPLDKAPMAVMSDYLPAGETTAWRFGKPAADLTAFGAAMAADPEVQKCAVARVWNWALGMTDIVDTLQDVPVETIQTQLDAFKAGGFKMRDLVFAAFTSKDFVSF